MDGYHVFLHFTERPIMTLKGRLEMGRKTEYCTLVARIGNYSIMFVFSTDHSALHTLADDTTT